MLRLRALVPALVVLLGVVPGAVAAGADDPAVPAACQDREIPLEEDEALVERTLWFHGQSDVGNVDGLQDVLEGGPSRLYMDDNEPAGTAHKIYASRATGVLGNPNFAANYYQGYWAGWLEQSIRLVCAEATVYAGSADGLLRVQLWADAPFGDNGGEGRVAVVTAEGPAAEVSTYTANFGNLDVTVFGSLIVQLDPNAPGALAWYDSAERPSHLTIVTVERVLAALAPVPAG